MPERGGWLPAALLAVGAITLLRIVALWFNRTDLFVDESQYWLWGQNPDFGYYSKPPLIGWVIRAANELGGSDAPFWVRLPGALLHGMTALILGALGARLMGARAAVWVAVGYATLPFAALGSLLISTDTIMAPFYAAALLAWFRAMDSGRAGQAALTGFFIGLAFLAKYAAVYFLIGTALAAVFVPTARLSLRQTIAMLAAFAVTVSPNIIWNLTHDLTTVEHTMDNVGWVRGGAGFGGLRFGSLVEFFLSQFAVAGPVVFAALIWGWVRQRGPKAGALTALSLPVLVIVSVQALLSQAYANWAVATYFAGLLIAVAVLAGRGRWLLWLSLAINGAVCVLLPLLTILAPWPALGDRPLLSRYLGQAALSAKIIEAAGAEGLTTVVATDRAVLADLFYTGRDSGLSIRTPAPKGRPLNYYEQMYPLTEEVPVLFVSDVAPVCDGVQVPPLRGFETTGGTYARRSIAGYRVAGGCLNAD